TLAVGDRLQRGHLVEELLRGVRGDAHGRVERLALVRRDGERLDRALQLAERRLGLRELVLRRGRGVLVGGELDACGVVALRGCLGLGVEGAELLMRSSDPRLQRVGAGRRRRDESGGRGESGNGNDGRSQSERDSVVEQAGVRHSPAYSFFRYSAYRVS